MPQQLAFFASIASSFVAWSIVTTRYLWPYLRHQSRTDALRPLLVLHSFRFAGLAFLVPGVTSRPNAGRGRASRAGARHP